MSSSVSEKIPLKHSLLFPTLIFLNLVFNIDSSIFGKHGMNWTTPELLQKDGYPSESHEVQTEDGYILQVHRIPYGKKCKPGFISPRVVLVEHGILCDSATWLTAGTKDAFGYLLADKCYDVWLGNLRGNTYGKKHATLSSNRANKKFWDFSFHEMGLYDIPATIEYILGKTGVSSLYYVGYSMGTTAGFIAMMERPEYNRKIKLMSLMAPVAYMGNLKGLAKPFAPKPIRSVVLDGVAAVFQTQELFGTKPYPFPYPAPLGQHWCNRKNPLHYTCTLLFDLGGGPDPQQKYYPWIENLLNYFPAGTSVKVANHFLQNVETGRFGQFDYGKIKNVEKYGKPKPPDYDWTKITVPVALYMGKNDYIAQPKDTIKLKQKLKNLKRYFVIKHSKFSHLEFLYAKDVKKLVYDPIISFMKLF